jgi:hypothetical protein
MRARQEKFDSDVHAFIRQRSAQGNNSTWLLFFGVTICEEKISADFDRLLKEKQTAMRVDHDRLGIVQDAANLSQSWQVGAYLESNSNDQTRNMTSASSSPALIVNRLPQCAAAAIERYIQGATSFKRLP